MPPLNTPFAIYKFLPQTNCRECHLPSCLAFAAAVIQGEKQLQNCPYLDHSDLEIAEPDNNRRRSIENEQEKKLELLQTQISQINFSSVKDTLGASLHGEKLSIPCLGKQFLISRNGNITSECHVNPWLTVPILDYILTCQGIEPHDKWVPFRELPNGQTWNPLFVQRCEKELKKVTDKHTDLLEDIIDIFSGKTAKTKFDSDISIVLHPLPKIPILICYWRQEDDMDSMLNIFFDQNAEKNLSIESLYMLSTGLVAMFEKISLLHG
jgi:Domain of unknown function (DUF3786)/Putative Fe-S cluster